jgi:hypothetical protein
VCAAGIIVTLFDALDSTNKLAVKKSAIENAATSEAHANWSPTPISATPVPSWQITRNYRLSSQCREKVVIALAMFRGEQFSGVD